MAKTNRDRVSEGLELLNKGLLPFIEREMKAIHGDKWKEEAAKSSAVAGEGGKKINWNDPQTALVVMWDHWSLIESVGSGL